jgi:hypothetical protein
MSNFNYRSQFHYSYAGQRVSLMAKISIGASGAPTIVSGTGMGIASVVRSSAGKYVINLSNSFYSLLSLSVISNSGSSAPAAPIVDIATDAVSSASAPAVTIQMRNLSAAAADPASGEVLYLVMDMNRSSTGN